MRLWLVLVVGALLCVPSAARAQAPTPSVIIWQLKNPFRYFKRAEHTAAHRVEFLRLNAQEQAEPILSVERRLAAKDSLRGWADAMFEYVVDEACWYSHPKDEGGSKPKGGTSTPCGDYILPKSHAILLTAPSIAGPCTWQIGSQRIPTPDCRKAAPAEIPYPTGADVVLSIPGRASLATEKIVVDDLLVIGLGDSIGAGEGNADRPVSFKQRRTMDYDRDLSGYPQRDGLKRDATYKDAAFANKAAGWVHRTCHRSLYSHQLRVALQLALEDPAQHRSVTFVGLACTGATILDLFNVYNGRKEKLSSAESHIRGASSSFPS